MLAMLPPASVTRLDRWGFTDPVFHDERFLGLCSDLESLGSCAVAYSGGMASR